MGKTKSSSISRSAGRWKFFSSDDKKEGREKEGKDLSKEQVSGNSKSKSGSAVKKKKRNDENRSKEDHVEKEVGRTKSDNERTVDEDRKKEKRAEKKEEGEASVFECVEGSAQPAQANVHGFKNKMRWKIDVEPVDVNGDQKIAQITEKMKEMKGKGKKEKRGTKRERKRQNDKSMEHDEDEDLNEEEVFLCGRILQHVKMAKIVEKEVSEADQEILRNYCRAGADGEKAEPIIEKLASRVLSSVVTTRNEFCRQITVPGQLRMFAVDEKNAKIPMIALLTIRKDLLYVAWSKCSEKPDKELDTTWSNMTAKKGKEKKEEKKEENKEKEKEEKKDKE